VELSTDEVEVRLVEREGMATQGDRELLVALDTTLDDDLIAEGWAREVIHRLQSARKEADLDYADRIRVRYRADPELETAIDTHRRWIAGETLATELAAADGDAVELETNPVEGMNFAFSLEKVN
jgi:isoleucyl-tRNA synthetase